MGVLEGKVAIVIGGTRGIGAAISRRLAADGASVGITYLNRADDAERLARELHAAGRHGLMVQADVSDAGALNEAIDQSVRHFGHLDILVSVAGTAIVGPLEAYADDAFDRSFALNVRAPFLAAKKAAGLMGEGGRIVTIGSIVADRMPGAGGTLYAASKAALGGMTRGLARDLRARGITANLVPRCGAVALLAILPKPASGLGPSGHDPRAEKEDVWLVKGEALIRAAASDRGAFVATVTASPLAVDRAPIDPASDSHFLSGDFTQAVDGPECGEPCALWRDRSWIDELKEQRAQQRAREDAPSASSPRLQR